VIVVVGKITRRRSEMTLRQTAEAEYNRVQCDIEATRKREEAERMETYRKDLRRLIETFLNVSVEEWAGTAAVVDGIYFEATPPDDMFDDNEDSLVLRACRECPECGGNIQSHPIKSLWALGNWLAGHTAPHTHWDEFREE
jgi:hypothetical protein